MAPITPAPVAQTARTHTSRCGQLFAAVVLAAAFLALSVGTAAAQDYPPGEIIVTTPNATITITGNDWGPGTTVEVTYHSPGASNATASAVVEPDGTFTAQLAIPATAALGHAEATVAGTDGAGQPREDASRLFVQDQADDGTSVALGSTPGESTAGASLAAGSGAVSGAGTVVPATNLPTTGVNLSTLAFALALLAAGGLALVVARRRQSTS